MSAFSKFFFRPGENERIETSVQLDIEPRSAIHGSVLDKEGRPITDALVMIFLTEDHPDALQLFSQMFTDENGHFFFGPLEPGRLYLVKAFKNSVKLRELEIIAE